MIPDPPLLLVFLGATALFLLTPGPAVLYIVARSVEQGRSAGLVSVLGIAAGGLAHVIAAAVGLSALLATSAAAYAAVQYLGAAYLIWLGIRKLRESDAVGPVPVVERKPYGRLFRDGVVVNVLNPKTALFFLSFLPQFTSPERGPVALQIVALGGIFAAMAVLSDGLYAVAAGSVAPWIRSHPGFRGVQRRMSGITFLGLGVLAALADRKA